MANKKMVLSILIIAFIGIVAAGTWANFTVSAERGGNTLTAGQLGLSIGQAENAAFAVDKIIPGQSEEGITYEKVICSWGWPIAIEQHYYVEPANTGNIPGALYISGTESANLQSLMDHIDIYYSTNPNSNNPTLLTDVATPMNIVLDPGQSTKVYFWYSYENVDSTLQNPEMGQQLSSTLKFELRNPRGPNTPPDFPIEE